jgi:TP901 family phage tail tape measure protein
LPDTIADIILSPSLDTSKALQQLRDFERRATLNIRVGDGAPLGRLTGKVSEFDKSLQAANARVLAFGASVGIIGTVTRAIEEMVTQSINLSKTLSDINAILGKPSSELKKFGNDLFEVAKQTGQSFNEAADAAKEFSRQGLGPVEILKRTKDAMILTRLSGLDLKESVSSLTAIFNTFEGQVKDTTDIVNRFANVDAKFAVSSKDFAEAFARVGNTAQDAKVEFNELIAVVTALKQRTGRDAGVIGNALKTIFTRIERSGTLEQLEELGVGVKNLNGDFLPGIQILSNFANKVNDLTDAQKALIESTVGGGFQINQLKALLGDLSSKNSIYTQALKGG